MNQMVNKNAQVMRRATFGGNLAGNFIRDAEGKIYFAGSQSGSGWFCWPVLADGRVSNKESRMDAIPLGEAVDVLSRQDLDIGKDLVLTYEKISDVRMKQMVAPEAPVIQEVVFATIKEGFFRRRVGAGEIFFAHMHGDLTFHLPVLADGTIASFSEQFVEAREIVLLIDPSSLGITEIRLSEKKPDD